MSSPNKSIWGRRLLCIGQILVKGFSSEEDIGRIDKALKTLGTLKGLKGKISSNGLTGDPKTKELLEHLLTADLSDDLECLIMSWDETNDYEELRKTLSYTFDETGLQWDLSAKPNLHALQICSQYPVIASKLRTVICTTKISKEYLRITEELMDMEVQDSAGIVKPPSEEAKVRHKYYVNKYLKDRKKILFVGMNPGRTCGTPSGVPFGDTDLICEWLNICFPKPSCPEEGQSGYRFWTLMREICGTPENFFRNCFVMNYCPLLFLDEDGTNNVPLPDLGGDTNTNIEEKCDRALLERIKLIGAEMVVAVGGYAYKRVKKVLRERHPGKNIEIIEDGEGNKIGAISSQPRKITVACICHPSTRNATKREDWEQIVQQRLESFESLDIYPVIPMMKGSDAER